jgi:hypothetical protein
MRMKRQTRTRRALWLLVMAAPWAVPGTSRALVNPVTLIQHQVIKPNILIVFDTSTSMINSPGDKDVDSNEVGQDCDAGDDKCRMVGAPGRCYFAGTGSAGAGTKNDTTSCTADSQCRVGFCKTGGGSCTVDTDCSGVGNYCTVFSNDVCVTSGAPSKVQMCQLGMNRCRTNADCTATPGDVCGSATSRMVLAKRVISGIVSSYYNSVNFGLMTFYQDNYYPYYPISGAMAVTNVTRYFDKDKLKTFNCWSKKTGPSSSCTIDNQLYTRQIGNDSRYRVKTGGTSFTDVDTSWCGSQWCPLSASGGTGYYVGSYYTYPVPQATLASTTPIIKTSYLGKTIVESGVTYMYWDPSPSMRNDNNVYGDNGGTEPIAAGDPAPAMCCATCGGRADATVAPFLDTTDDPTKAKDMAYAILQKMDKAGLGGVAAEGFTPTGCALGFGGSAAATDTNNALSYLQKVKSIDPLSCRNDYVLLITDGSPNRAYDVACNSPACSAADPKAAGCTCQAVKSAQDLKAAGVTTFVVGFSNATTDPYTHATLDNIARAGGTPGALFAVQEGQLRDQIVSAIYQAARGSYSTSPASSSSGVQTPTSVTMGTMVLDSRVDFPGWKGQLIAYETSGGTPTVAWSASTVSFNAGADPDFWKKRNVWTSSGTTMVKFQVDPTTGAILNKDQLASLGLGVNGDEAERVARWMLGDPLMKNPAVLGAILNSTPIDVGPPGNSPLPGGTSFYNAHINRPFLVYTGSSDGMLHAFFTKPTTIGANDYPGGKEAFAYIPQSMLQVANKLYAQGGQLPDPKDHIYGLANSAKVKSLCVSNCDGASGTPVWKTVLVMAYGFGGTEAFVLDITDPFDANGVVASGNGPAPLLWHTQYETPSTTAAYDNDLGLTTSVPAFYYAKSATKDDFRLIFGSYWTDSSTSSTGKVLFNASASTGAIKDTIKINPAGSCPQTLGLMSDVATARNFSVNEETQIHAAYFGDTWGNLYRYVPTVSGPSNFTDTTGNLSLIDALTCQHPIHYAPAIVQLDRDLNANHGGEIYIVQVTNSALDDETRSYPPSKMVIRRDVASAPGAVADDPTFTKITLTAGVAAEMCGVMDTNGTTCLSPLPTNARPNATPMAVLKKDGSGFQIIGTWYAPAVDSCANGATYLTIHEFTVTGGVVQRYGMKLASEPVTSAVFAGGKLMFVKQGGVTDLTSMLPAGLTWGPGMNSGPPGGNERLRVLNWSEVP